MKRVLKVLRLCLAAFCILLISLSVFLYLHIPQFEPPSAGRNLIDDASSLNQTKVEEVAAVKEEEDVRKALGRARSRNLKVSIAGKRHSMGGQTFFKDAVVLDMTQFNKLEAIDEINKVITVQSGATWEDIQIALNAKGLAVIAMQGPNIFTVGGSLSVNAHGWDKSTPAVADTVEWFRIMLADGTVRRCSLQENAELFSLVLGGYGLFGVILDVGLRVTTNDLLAPRYASISYKDLNEHFNTVTNADKAIRLSYGDLSIASDSYLKELIVSDFAFAGGYLEGAELGLIEESYVLRDSIFLNISRQYDWGKKLRWFLYKKFQLPEDYLSRNNLMRSAFKRLRYYSPQDTDILQEYFIPRDHATAFVDNLRAIVRSKKANLLNCTVRIINKSNTAFLNYAKNDSFAFVLYFNVNKDQLGREQDRQVTSELVSAAIKLGGTFYLPYLPNYDYSQLKAAYPEIDEFLGLKKKYDPEERFMNYFYERISGSDRPALIDNQ